MAPSRKQTPDVLGQVLTPASQSPGVPVDHPTSAPAYQRDSGSDAEKMKATFYLAPAVLEALDDAWIRLRRRGKTPARGKVSKSLLVEVAVQMALEDLAQAGEESTMAQRVRAVQAREP